jgi:activator of aromatic catabolism/V4R domain-containing protein
MLRVRRRSISPNFWIFARIRESSGCTSSESSYSARPRWDSCGRNWWTRSAKKPRRVLLRFGFADGYNDAVNLRARSNWASPLDGLRSGAMLHTLEGIVRADVRRAEYDEESGRFEEEVSWHDSYEAEQHIHHYGKSSAPVCWSLVGYSSGFVSACLGKDIYFREMTCAGQGERHCSAIERDLNSWGAEIDPFAPTSRRRTSVTRSSACATPSGND